MAQREATLLHRWFEEVWNQGDETAIDRMFAEDGLAHGMGEPLRGPAEFKPFHRKFRTAIPDIRIDVEDALTDGEMVVTRCTVHGTHTGPGLLPTVTGKPVQFTGICIARVRDGKIQEAWNNFDFLALYEQLGMKLS